MKKLIQAILKGLEYLARATTGRWDTPDYEGMRAAEKEKDEADALIDSLDSNLDPDETCWPFR